MFHRLSTAILPLCLGGVIAAAQPANAQTFNSSFANATTGNTELATASFFLGTSATQTAGTCTLGYFCVTAQNTSTFGSYSNADLVTGLEFSADFTFSTTPATTTLTAKSAVASSIFNSSKCTISCTGTNLSLTDYWGSTYSANGSNGATGTTGIPAVNHPVYVLNTSGFSNMRDYSQTTAIVSASNEINCTSPQYNGTCGSGKPDWSIVGSAITSAGGNPGPLANNSITFGFLMPSNVTSFNVSNVYFLYGTNPDGSSVARAAAEPATLAILASGLVGFAAVRRRRDAA